MPYSEHDPSQSMEVAAFRFWLDHATAEDFMTLEDLEDAEQWASLQVAEVVHVLTHHHGWNRSRILGLLEGTLDGLLGHWREEGG